MVIRVTYRSSFCKYQSVFFTFYPSREELDSYYCQVNFQILLLVSFVILPFLKVCVLSLVYINNQMHARYFRSGLSFVTQRIFKEHY